jgi:hypothetical protein
MMRVAASDVVADDCHRFIFIMDCNSVQMRSEAQIR